MKQYDIYLIDFDGTLINSYDGLFYFYKETFGAFNVNIDKDLAYKLSKISLQQAYAELIGDTSLIPEFTKKCDEIVASKILLQYNKSFEDTIPFINYIKDNNISSGIITGNTLTHVEMVLNNLKINNFYNIFIGSDDLNHQKPDPEGILLALKKLGYNGEKKNVCYVGDSWNDYLAAKNAGVTPILINRFNEYKPSEDYILISSLEELITNKS